ncbi:uncharacterized protein LOC8063080 isoform X1 [Sorghum bicolor]|uniref:uncharacterized protein LOC8063080 isoform X1 n=1 Tax=Sorghum bicolor TaxID=4558 RepID=UPI000B42543D|nr:uncharacterized protein LOC8063080 isoform X1 [Sorghum bicolor]|eukprot:XP_021312778.1 uncharacterized protein LOC8063080 isoform X1 [Sorghum bicolor]
MLLYEFVENGNLEQWLQGDVGPVSPLTWETRMNIAVGTAKGSIRFGKLQGIESSMLFYHTTAGDQNYQTTKRNVLNKEFPRGVDVIYETVGGETFDVCLNALAVYGRIIVIGMISQAGFFLIQYAHLWKDHLEKLFNLYASGKLKLNVESLHHLTKEGIRRHPQTTGEEVHENDCVLRFERRYRLASRGNHRTTLFKESSINHICNILRRDDGLPKLESNSSHGVKFLRTN